LIALFIVVNLTGFSENIRGFFYSISSPIQKNLWSAGADVSGFFSGIFRQNELKSENENLKAQNSQLLLQLANLNDLEQENETLRNALNIGLDKEYRLFLVQVVGKDVGKDTIVIDKGSKDGLSEGLALATAQKVLVGRISQVYDNYSKVDLVTNPAISFGVKVFDSGALGEAKGAGNLKIDLGKIPQGQEISEGDAVISTSLGGIFPGGLLVGQIKNVKKSDTESFQKAAIQPAFSISELGSLFVIIDF
jgi:rod shape-determining protein MreC